MAKEEVSIHEYINILFLGEAGAGKSTLINSFANYSVFRNFKEAIDGEDVCLIPTKFSFLDENLQATKVEAGLEDVNEDLEEGQAGTLSCKSYAFRLNDELGIRFIDTSGYSDTKGSDKDSENLEDILDYALLHGNIHAFAIVTQASQMSGNQPTHMENFLNQIFMRLGKDALRNVIFIFTHGTKPAGLTTMKLVIEKVKKNFKWTGELNLERKNIFCFENKVFRELFEIKRQLLRPNLEQMKENQKHWETSTKEFQRLIHEIVKFKPYQISESLSGQKAIKYIRNVSVILGIVLANIYHNKNKLDSQKQSDITKIKLTPEDTPITLCLSLKKCNYTNKEIEEKYRCYGRNVCCEGCELKFGRRSCKQIYFLTAKCKKCKCNFKKHHFLFYRVNYEMVVDVSNYQKNLEMEKQIILNGIKELINCIEIKSIINQKDKATNPSNYPFAISKELYWKTWNGNPTTDVSKIKEVLEKLPIYGPVIRDACHENEKNKLKEKENRDIKVKHINNVFKAQPNL